MTDPVILPGRDPGVWTGTLAIGDYAEHLAVHELRQMGWIAELTKETSPYDIDAMSTASHERHIEVKGDKASTKWGNVGIPIEECGEPAGAASPHWDLWCQVLAPKGEVWPTHIWITERSHLDALLAAHIATGGDLIWLSHTDRGYGIPQALATKFFPLQIDLHKRRAR